MLDFTYYDFTFTPINRDREKESVELLKHPTSSECE